jgi:hypothetical protein
VEEKIEEFLEQAIDLSTDRYQNSMIACTHFFDITVNGYQQPYAVKPFKHAQVTFNDCDLSSLP